MSQTLPEVTLKLKGYKVTQAETSYYHAKAEAVYGDGFIDGVTEDDAKGNYLTAQSELLWYGSLTIAVLGSFIALAFVNPYVLAVPAVVGLYTFVARDLPVPQFLRGPRK